MFILVAAVVLAGWVLPGSGFAQGQHLDIVFIDLDNVFTNFSKTKVADALHKERVDEFREKRKGMIETVKAAGEEYKALQIQAQSPALNEKARAEKLVKAEEALLNVKKLEKELAQVEKETRKRLEEQLMRTQKRLVAEISNSLEEYAEENEWIAVLDSSGDTMNGVPTVVYYKPELDITAAFIERINK